MFFLFGLCYTILMPTPKYKSFIDQMYKDHKACFASFKVIHDNFALDRKKWRKDFDKQGSSVLDIMRDYEHKLCSGMEKGKYASYSIQLSEKYWEEIKKQFKFIDLVGVESSLG